MTTRKITAALDVSHSNLTVHLYRLSQALDSGDFAPEDLRLSIIQMEGEVAVARKLHKLLLDTITSSSVLSSSEGSCDSWPSTAQQGSTGYCSGYCYPDGQRPSP